VSAARDDWVMAMLAEEAALAAAQPAADAAADAAECERQQREAEDSKARQRGRLQAMRHSQREAEEGEPRAAVVPTPLPLCDALRRAEGLLCAEPDGSGDAYPVEALGALAPAARALSEGAQVDVAMASQSLLAAAALLVQGVANARSLDGAVKPLSVYALTVALSGDGKDAADRVALQRVHDRQRRDVAAHARAMAEHERASATRKRGDPPPDAPPREPQRLAADATTEGLRRAFVQGQSSQGLFSTEGGLMLAGHAMSDDHRIKSASALCTAWDRGHLSVVRGGAARVDKYGMRLSVHLLVQPSVAGEALIDEALHGVGLWPRFLLAWPPPLAPRVYRPWRPEHSEPIREYWGRCDELLARPLPDDCDELSVIEMTDKARRGMAGYFDSMEVQARRGELRDVRAIALRATEQACRIAGVLAAFGGRDQIDEQDALAGGALANYSVATWQRALAGRADPVPGWALTLYRWLAAERPDGVALRDIPRLAPMTVRPAARRDAALARLRDLGLVSDLGGRIIALGVCRAGA
jgi:hypothetical protein